MLPISVLKDIFVFVSIIPFAILFLLIVAVFYIWKTFVLFLLKLLYWNKEISFLGPMDLYFISLEGTVNYYLNPRKVLPMTLVLDGVLEEAELKNRFQNEVIEFRDSKKGAVYKRLRQKHIKRFGYIFFIPDENFTIDNHIRTMNIPLNEESVLEFVKKETLAPFKPSSSLWEIILVPNFNGENKTLLFFRVHHTFMDGFSILSIFKRGCGESLVSTSPTQATQAPSQSVLEWIQALYQNTIGMPRKYILEQKNRRNLKPTVLTKKFFLGKTGNIPLRLFKTLKKQNDVTFTLAIHSAVSSALSESIVGHGIALLGLNRITSMIAFPASNAGKAAGNSFILADFNIPIGSMTTEQRIQKCREEMVKTKGAISPRVIGLMAELGNCFPSTIFMKYFVPSMSEEEGVIISNMPGPSEGCKFWNRDVLDISFSVIACENPWLTVAIISFSGDIRVSISGIEHVFKSETEFQIFTNNFIKALDSMLTSCVV